MVAPTSQASPLSMRAYASARLTFPTRTDLISVPVRTMPASNESSIEYSWRALRFWATVFSSPMASSWVRCGLAVTRLADRRQDGGSNNPTAGIYGRWAPVRTEAGLGRNRGPVIGSDVPLGRHASSMPRDARMPAPKDRHSILRSIAPPAGGRSLEPGSERGGAAHRQIRHCTSPPFVLGHIIGRRARGATDPYGRLCSAGAWCRAGAAGAAGARGRSRSRGGAGPDRRCRLGREAQLSQTGVQNRVGPGPDVAQVDRHVRHETLALDPNHVRGELAGDRQVNTAKVVG